MYRPLFASTLSSSRPFPSQTRRQSGWLAARPPPREWGLPAVYGVLAQAVSIRYEAMTGESPGLGPHSIVAFLGFDYEPAFARLGNPPSSSLKLRLCVVLNYLPRWTDPLGGGCWWNSAGARTRVAPDIIMSVSIQLSGRIPPN